MEKRAAPLPAQCTILSAHLMTLRYDPKIDPPVRLLLPSCETPLLQDTIITIKHISSSSIISRLLKIIASQIHKHFMHFISFQAIKSLNYLHPSNLRLNGQVTFDGKWEKAHGHCADLNAVTPTCPLLLEMSRQSRCSSDDS